MIEGELRASTAPVTQQAYTGQRVLASRGHVVISSEIHLGAEALKLADSASFQKEWLALHKQCPWATAFQRPEFAGAWYATYAKSHEPLIAVARTPDGKLAGLFTGGRSPKGLHAVGGHQAEYRGWLAAPVVHVEAIDAIISALDSICVRTELHLRYLPPGFPIEQLLQRSRHRSRMAVRTYARPIMDLDADAASLSLKKKGNKSKFNRLQRLGPVTLEVIKDVNEHERILDEVIAQYDRRQLETNGYEPFASDAAKRPFHVEMMRRGLLHVSALKVGERIAAAHLGVCSGDQVFLAIVSFDQELANESPNKLLLLLLAQSLAGEGFRILDLTPGGDSWKDRFANRFEDVHEFRIFRSSAARILASVSTHIYGAIRELDSRFLHGVLARVRKKAALRRRPRKTA